MARGRFRVYAIGMKTSPVALLPLLALASLLSACGTVHGPGSLAHSRCAPPNDAVPRNGEFVVCMNGRP